ncbi:hypothetical protein [Prochlorococcus marinus]|uniref:hypothetical protein n=1 Tax=Prochlorococcus marinus TaxID=1219 RepID=UPI0022B3051E|nr:hypothetical protein [Prochlorococcus marinus]
MNYQLLLEYYAEGSEITRQEAELLDLELYSQVESIKLSSSQGCIAEAPKHICKKALVCEGSLWITCLAAVLDQLSPPSLGQKSRGAKVFDELFRNGYLQS